MRELPTSKILVQVLAAEEHLVDIAGAWDVPGGGAYLFQFSAFRKHTMKIYGTMQPLNMQAVRIADGRPMAGIKTSSKCSQPQKSPPACWASEVSSFERSTDRRFLKSTNQWSIFFGLIPASATRTLTALLHLLSAVQPWSRPPLPIR